MSEDQILPAQEIVRAAWGHADCDGNDRRTRIVYAAGFFDGEGWVSIKTHKVYQPNLMIGVGQLVREPLDLLLGLWGGSINQGKDGMFRWQIGADRSANALREMLPYLMVKRTQAEIGIRFNDQRDRSPRKWADPKEGAREGTRRYRARQRGEDVPKPNRRRITPEMIERGLAFKQELVAARP